MPKHRLAFSKADTAKFISHLDLMRTFQRSFLRAAMAIKHTEGFNPHAFVSIPLPLSVSLSGGLECQVLEHALDGSGGEDERRPARGHRPVQRCYEAVRPVKDVLRRLYRHPGAGAPFSTERHPGFAGPGTPC